MKDKIKRIRPFIQLEFFFVWPADVHLRLAHKSMIAQKREYGPVMVHRNRLNVWIVTARTPIMGPSGRIGASFDRVYDQLFFTGTAAWDFAKKLSVSWVEQDTNHLLNCLLGR